MPKKTVAQSVSKSSIVEYRRLLKEMVSLLESARHASARAVNSVMTATYWQIGRRIVEVEQQGELQATYGDELIKRLADDLTTRFGRGFGWRNLYQMRAFHLVYREALQTITTRDGKILQTVSANLDGSPLRSKLQTVSAKSSLVPEQSMATINHLAPRFPLPWSHYVKLLTVEDQNARQFYETEALKGGWSVRQLDRQISTLFYERTILSKNKSAILRKKNAHPEDIVTPHEEIKDPLVLEFLDLKDEYSEHDFEEALIHKLEDFLLELGTDFTFVGRQKRLRIGNEWYRIDLLFFHRRLRCLVVIDLKLGKFTHADSGQMHLYLNYAREHWTAPDENPPVGLILCAKKDEAVAHYALENLPNKTMVAQYLMALPGEKVLATQIQKTHKALALRKVPTAANKPKPRIAQVKKKTTKKKK
jgi:predicted nuclease of restriction endonuclease-like (RecB) superfamily